MPLKHQIFQGFQLCNVLPRCVMKGKRLKPGLKFYEIARLLFPRVACNQTIINPPGSFYTLAIMPLKIKSSFMI